MTNIEQKSDFCKVSSELHREALEYAALGWPVFPCLPNSKQPATPHGFKDATTDAAQINAWWTENPSYNIAFEPEQAGLAIIDADLYHEGCNVAALNLPETFEVETPRGGTHFYFAGSVPMTVGDPNKPDKGLGPYIDTRGRSSYALLPPSVINGAKYAIRENRSVACLPIEIETRLQSRAEPATAKERRQDLSGMVATARGRLLKQNRVAVEGQRGHDTCYEIACELVRDLGISTDLASELMLEVWYPHCTPNDQPNFVRDRVLSAGRNGQNEIGAHATAPVAEVFANANLPAITEPNIVFDVLDRAPRNLIHPVPFANLMSRPLKPVQEIIPGLIEKGIATMLAGPGGTHKSRVALQWGLSIQAGLPVFGKPVEQCTFVYLDYENGADEITRRTHKMQYRLNLPADTEGHYHDFTGKSATAHNGPLPASELSPPLALIEETGITCQPLYFQMFDFLRSIPGYKFVVADSTYNILRFTGQTKINESAVKGALNLLDYLCAATDSTMLFLWHPSQAGQERGDASGWSVAWHNTPRARLSLSKDKEAADTFKLKVEKRNNGPEGVEIKRWSRLSEQNLRVDKWSVCQC